MPELRGEGINLPEQEKKQKKKKHFWDRHPKTFVNGVLAVVILTALGAPVLLNEEVRLSWQTTVDRKPFSNDNHQLEEGHPKQLFETYKSQLRTLNAQEWNNVLEVHKQIASTLYTSGKYTESFDQFFDGYMQDLSQASERLHVPFEVALIALTNTPMGGEEGNRDYYVGVVQQLGGAYSSFYGIDAFATKALMDWHENMHDWRVFNNISVGQLDAEPVVMARGLFRSENMVNLLKEQNPEVADTLQRLRDIDKLLLQQEQQLAQSIQDYAQTHPELSEKIFGSNRQETLKSIGISSDGINDWYLSRPTVFWQQHYDQQSGNEAQKLDSALQQYQSSGNPLVSFLKDVSFAPDGINIWQKLLSEKNGQDVEVQAVIEQIKNIRKLDQAYILYERQTTDSIARREFERTLSVQLAVSFVAEWNGMTEEKLGEYDTLSQKDKLLYQLCVLALNDVGKPKDLAESRWGLRHEETYAPEDMLDLVLSIRQSVGELQDEQVGARSLAQEIMHMISSKYPEESQKVPGLQLALEIMANAYKGDTQDTALSFSQ